MRGRALGKRLVASLLAATTFVAGPIAPASASSLSADTVNRIIAGCVGNTALVWATPGSGKVLCPCYVHNVLAAPDLMDAQRLYVLAFIAGRAAMGGKAPPLTAERQQAAFQYFLSGRMQRGCSA